MPTSQVRASRSPGAVGGSHTLAVFDRQDELGTAGHEQVVFCHDRESGLKAIISIHDTSLGPALGGTRFFPYANEAYALTDSLRLAQGMTFKAAAAGLSLGGGKGVIIGDPSRVKTDELLAAYGRFVESLGGRYITAADVGTTAPDMDVISRATGHVVGRTKSAGGSGDSGFSTAYGVLCAMRAAADFAWSGDLSDRVVGVEGAGKTGFQLTGLLVNEGAHVVLCEPDAAARERVLAAYPDVEIADSVLEARVDVYAPCAMGATLSSLTIESVRASVVCGAANNQLLTADVGDDLAARGIVWVPDFLANAGGLCQVGGELERKSPAQVRADIEKIGSTVSQVLAQSAADQVTPGRAVAQIVAERLQAAARDRR
jgi:valine dehydrogenase (NAD+)